MTQDAAQGAGFASEIMDYVVKAVTGAGTAAGEVVSELPDRWQVDGFGQVVRVAAQGQRQQGQQGKAGDEVAITAMPRVSAAAAGSVDTAAEGANATPGSAAHTGDKAAPAAAMKLYAAISLDGGPVVPVRAKVKVYQYDVGPWHMCTLYDLRRALTAAHAANVREGVVVCPEELPARAHGPAGNDGAEAPAQQQQESQGSQQLQQQQQPQQEQPEQQTPLQQQGSLALPQVVWLHTCRLYQPRQQPGVCVLVMDVTAAAVGVTKAAAAAARGGPVGGARFYGVCGTRSTSAVAL